MKKLLWLTNSMLILFGLLASCNQNSNEKTSVQAEIENKVAVDTKSVDTSVERASESGMNKKDTLKNNSQGKTSGGINPESGIKKMKIIPKHLSPDQKSIDSLKELKNKMKK